jgi:LacI family transcriptional regulator
VRQPIAEMAREAVQSLVRRVRALRDGDPGDAGEPEQVRMAFELVRRQSDAAPRIRPPARLPLLAGAAQTR